MKNNVHKFRKELRYTRIEFAKKAKMSKVTLDSIERDPEYSPRLITMINVAKVFNKPVSEVFNLK